MLLNLVYGNGSISKERTKIEQNVLYSLYLTLFHHVSAGGEDQRKNNAQNDSNSQVDRLFLSLSVN